MHPTLRHLAVLGIVLATMSAPAQAQTPPSESDAERYEYLRSHYTKTEYRIPMRDGTRLFTAVYAPNDAGPTQRYPLLMVRTPYTVAPYGVDRYARRLGPTAQYEKEGFIFVFQDVRGQHMSEGTFVNMRPHLDKKGPKDFDESSDTFDTIDWLLKHVPGHNGRVGQWGISYPGFYTSAGAIDSHPALKAVSPQAPIADWFWDDMHRNGAFNLVMAFNFFSGFGLPRPAPTPSEEWKRFEHGTPDAYQFFLELGALGHANERHFKGDIAFWNDLVAHPNYDAFWQSRDLLPHLKNIKAAVLVVGGWFDTEDLYGPLRTYAAIEKQNPGTSNSLLMGPWIHGGWVRSPGASLGDADFGFPTAELYRQLGFDFFKHHLKGGEAPALAEATVFETGANRWRRFESWPPRPLREQRLYFQPKGALTFQAPAAQAPAAGAFDEYVSDPAKPVPYTQEITSGWAKDYMTEDQRFAARRPDVLVYQTEPLEKDLTLAGPMEAELFVSTTGTDADWVVKLIDVNPGKLPGAPGPRNDDEPGAKNRGHQQTLVRADPFRGRFRESFSQPKAFTPGEVTRVRFTLNDVLHTFPRGHRVMIQVQSSWFPFIDRNPQTFVPNIFEARDEDFVKATHRLHHTPQYPSSLKVGVLPTLDE